MHDSHETTGRLISPGGIPLNVGAVVAMSKLVNIAAAAELAYHKTLPSLVVAEPMTLTVPLAQACATASRQAAPGDGSGALCRRRDDGRNLRRPHLPVTKTTGNRASRDHHVIQRKLKPAPARDRQSARPMPLLHRIRPFVGLRRRAAPVMPTLHGDQRHINERATMCCSCACAPFACPESLPLRRVISKADCDAPSKGRLMTVKPHPAHAGGSTRTDAPLATGYAHLALWQGPPCQRNSCSHQKSAGTDDPSSPLATERGH